MSLLYLDEKYFAPFSLKPLFIVYSIDFHRKDFTIIQVIRFPDGSYVKPLMEGLTTRKENIFQIKELIPTFTIKENKLIEFSINSLNIKKYFLNNQLIVKEGLYFLTIDHYYRSAEKDEFFVTLEEKELYKEYSSYLRSYNVKITNKDIKIIGINNKEQYYGPRNG